jgi:N-methylhydantoinase A
MERDGNARLEEADVPRAQRRHERWVEARYRRQVHHLRVAAPARVDAAGLARMMADFEIEYERLFGRGAALKDAGIEFVNYGVDSVGVAPAMATRRWAAGADVAPRTRRMTWCPQSCRMVSTPVYDGPALPAHAQVTGPAIIEHPGTTIVVLAGQTASIDEQRHTHIVITPSAA